jgi:hypothetical protein
VLRPPFVWLLDFLLLLALVVEDVSGVVGFSEAVFSWEGGPSWIGRVVPTALRRDRARVVAIRIGGCLPINVGLLYRIPLH